MNNITLPYNDALSVNFTSDAWFDATTVAKHFDKRPTDWLSLDSTNEYIANLCEIISSEKSSLLKIIRGGRGKSDSTWFHPRLAVAFARWLDVRFSIWCDMQIEKIMHPVQYDLKQLPEPPTATKAQLGVLFNRVKTISSGSGKIRAELWSRFQNHFKLNSYKELPYDKFDEAMAYLDAKQEEYNGGVEMFYISSKELESKVAERLKALDGEVMPKPEANCITVSLGKGSGLKTITLRFEADDTSYNRWFVCNDGGNFVIKPMPDDEMPLTFEQWIKYATQERGYIVGKPAELMSKLSA